MPHVLQRTVAALGVAIWLIVAPVFPANSNAASSVEIYYAPEDLPGERLAALYGKASRYIYVAIYGITYPPIVKALVAAHKRGVDVRVITDREKLNDPKQQAALETLRLAGIPIKVNRHENLMHLKQVVMDDEINTSGSMNQTGSGNRYNDERLDVFTDPITSVKARDKFLAMWKDTERYQDWK
ncbi:MAG TPA: phospholipase D-like domain-containing protein [Nitrospiraceae bacterium]|nr:phospholipase D-like domain-containing protein [Nitrospiraceae bacterium]